MAPYRRTNWEVTEWGTTAARLPIHSQMGKERKKMKKKTHQTETGSDRTQYKTFGSIKMTKNLVALKRCKKKVYIKECNRDSGVSHLTFVLWLFLFRC